MKITCLLNWRKNEFLVNVKETENGYVGYFTTDKIHGYKATYRVVCNLDNNTCKIYLRNDIDHLHECECVLIKNQSILDSFKEEGTYIQTTENTFVKVVKVIGNDIILDRYVIFDNEIVQKTILMPFLDIKRYVSKENMERMKKINLDDVFALISKKDIVKEF